MKTIIATLQLLVVLCIGCSNTPQKKVVAPSIKDVQAEINSAADGTRSAQAHNVKARTLAERIDAKDRLIDKWHSEHQ